MLLQAALPSAPSQTSLSARSVNAPQRYPDFVSEGAGLDIPFAVFPLKLDSVCFKKLYSLVIRTPQDADLHCYAVVVLTSQKSQLI